MIVDRKSISRLMNKHSHPLCGMDYARGFSEGYKKAIREVLDLFDKNEDIERLMKK